MFEFEQIVHNKNIKDTKVMVAMSGGVDSSTVAAYLHHLGYQVIGVTLQLYSSDEKQFKKTCCAGQDIYDAKNVASQFGFPHYVINLEKVFQEDVIQNFAETYLRGETPIPCVRCNQTVKFRDLFKIAKDLNVDALATGHYVQRIENRIGNIETVELHKGIDKSKDQSYFLFATTREQLQFLRFPLGNFTKEYTRKLAQSLNISISQKPESQDICFVKSGKYVDIINKIKPQSYESGEILHINGQILGKHSGIVNYTVGQRHGLNVSYSEPLYVIRIDSIANKIIVGPKSSLKQKQLYVKELNWIDNNKIHDGLEVEVKLRSGAETVRAVLTNVEKTNGEKTNGEKANGENSLLKVVLLNEPNCAISPGQACVMYDGMKVLGGGWITRNEID